MCYITTYAQQEFTLNDIPLTWRNFIKKEVPRQSRVGAQTHIKIDIEYDLRPSSRNRNNLEIKLNIIQSKDESWVSKSFLMTASDDASLKLLNHERLHYVINLIGFKKMYNELKDYNYTEDYKTQITSIFRKYTREIDKMNAEYDKQTYHGTSLKNQTKWENQVMTQFNELYAYDKSIPTSYTINTTIQ